MILKRVLPFMWLLVAAWSGLYAQTVGGACLQGATVTTRSGATSVDICQGDGLPDIYRFRTSPAAMPFAYLITDENNTILGVSASNIINLEGYPVGALRVWAFSYFGGITAEQGQNAMGGALASICSGLSGNYVTVNSINPAGGTVTTSVGASSAFACVDNTGSNVISFTSSNTGSNYSYVITTEANIIVAVASGNAFDFANVPPGTYRVWGVAHAGALNAPIGANITTSVLSSQCFGLSSNFVNVLRGDADGGSIKTVSGALDISFCRPQDAVNVGLTFQSASPAGYLYVLTNTSNQIISILPGNTFEPAGLPLGNYRIWGLSYSGNILAQPGDDAAQVALTDACYDLSDNFISVSLQDVKGGTIEITNGALTSLCVGDGDADIVAFAPIGAGGGNYAFIVTDEAATTVLSVSQTGSFDFDDFEPGNVLVWGLSYTGNLAFLPGQSILSLLDGLECNDLSENSIPFTLIRTDGGSVALLGGALDINICTGDGASDELTFTTSSDADVNYTYVVTDANNIIIAFSPSGVVDFEGAGVGVVRVWGLSYSGNVMVLPGDNAATSTLSDGCYDLSDNFVTVNLLRTRGGLVSLSDGTVSATLCVNDGASDELTFSNNSGFAPNYAYLVTDESNIIIEVSSSGTLDFEGSGFGVVRIWGVSYTGNLTAQPGDDAAVVMLSDECFDLSNNFVTVIKQEVFGGTVQTLFGQTELDFCGGDGFADLAIYFSTAQAFGDYAFLITDANNTVLKITSLNSVDFEGFGAGSFRIWGFSYTGDLTVEIADNAATAALSNGCYTLSENFIAVTINVVDGGVVSLFDGGTVFLACAADGIPDVPQVTSTANDPDAEYTWLLTNESNIILAVSPNAAFDFDGLAIGSYRIWGLGYTGNLQAVPGQQAGSASLATSCFALSFNYVQVQVDAVNGGTIAIADGRDLISVCLSDGVASEPVEFTTTGSSSGDYVYIITNENNLIVGFLNGNVVSFEDTLAEGRYRIWGLAYSGRISASIRDNAAEVPLSNGCYALSDNFILLIVGTPSGGNLKFSTGGGSRVICPDNGMTDVLEFSSDSEAILPYVFLITDADNIIVDIIYGNSYDFDLTDMEELRIWGLSYAGFLLAQIGDDAAEVVLASECYELSDNFLTVLLQTPDGGSISLGDGTTSVSACGGPFSDVQDFFTDSDFAGSYTYVITNTSNVILDIVPATSYDFSSINNDTVRVWGFAYTGNLVVNIGDNAATAALSDDCYDLSDNFITVYRANPIGGTLTTTGGLTEVLRCAGDGDSDLIPFIVEGASNAPYLFLITDENNYLIGITTQPSFDFENAINGVFRIHGLSYTGIFQLFPGDSIFGPIPPSSGCFDFADTFIELTNVRVNGGTLFSDVPQTVFYTCPADGIADEISFFNSSNASNAEYAYLFTNEDNVILGLTFQNSFNFDIAGIGVTRIWGVSYTGNFIANFGDNAATTPLSDECFDLSNNFLTVIRDIPAGGLVSTQAMETEIQYCQGIDDPELTVVTTSASLALYTFALTNAFNDILAFSSTGIFDLSGLETGTYRVWGVSFTGMLNTNVTNILDIELGTSCLEISANFVTINVTVPIVGGFLTDSEGATEVRFCPSDGISDLVEVNSTSSTPATNYRFVVTNQNGLVFIPDLAGNSIDFEGAGEGEYRIYGIAFTGNYLVNIGTNLNTAALSSACFQLSENFVRVVNAEAFGGTVSTDEGEVFLQIDTQDGEPDTLTFVNTGATDLPYVYVLTDVEDIVLEYLDGDTYDFEGRDEPGLRIWGLSYFGAQPTATGVLVSSLASAANCSDLSDNFVSILTGTPVLQDDHSITALRASAQPNPAVDVTTLNVWSTMKDASAATILILDGTGRIRKTYRLPKLESFQQMEMDISNLESGIYTVQIRNANAVTTVRLVKGSL